MMVRAYSLMNRDRLVRASQQARRRAVGVAMAAAAALAAHAFLPSAWAASSTATLLRATALLKRPLPHSAAEHERAYAMLEQMMAPAGAACANGADGLIEVQAAQLLALGPQRSLKQRGRHDYAARALQCGSDQLTQLERDALLRVSGDGSFDAAKLADARLAYQQLEQSPDSESADYAAYKLGWIDLNEAKADQAWERWMARLSHGATPLLRESITRDLGRAWAEMTDREPLRASNRARIVSEWLDSLSRSEREKLRAKVIDGLTMGMRRIADASALEAFRNDLRTWNGELAGAYPEILTRALTQNIGFGKYPCAVARWQDAWTSAASPARAKVADKEGLRAVGSLLNACIAIKPEFRRVDISDEALVAAIRSLPVEGDPALAHETRAQLMEKIAGGEVACQERLSALPAYTAMSEAFRVCGPLAGPAAARVALWTELYRVEREGSSLSAADRAAVPTLATRWLEHAGPEAAGAADRLLAELTRAPGNYRGSDLAVVALDALKYLPESARPAARDRLLAELAPRPLPLDRKASGLWLAVIRDQMQARGGADVATLESFLPLNEATIQSQVARELWMRWAIETLTPKTSAGAPAAALSGDTTTRAHTLLALLATRQQNGKLASLSAEEFAMELQVSPGLTERFLHRLERGYPEGVSAGLEAELAQRLWKSELPPARLTGLAGRGKAIGACALEGREQFPRACASVFTAKAATASAPTPAFYRDWLALEQRGLLANAAFKNLRLNAALPRRIETELARLKADLEWVQKQPWSAPVVAERARSLALARCDQWLGALRGISLPRALTGEDRVAAEQVLTGVVQNVTQVVEGWKQQMKGTS